ncbi:general transcription factor 3C polypeptide 6 [Chelonus insularis]|uniref:general transcription factor 3C polypeptide 6 n=1 Tax=Chelonus insularis TaxID=460826 RepID=UPI00158F528A|nr:general transcription factor 3C polypeptide 6 [Chelonus insularis]
MSGYDSPLEEDEEETLVYVEFEGLSGPDTFCNENLQLDMIGLDTEHPLIKVNDKYYEGTYEDAVGTYMFFENDDNPKFEDPIFDTVPTFKFFTKTNKILKMKRVFVKPKLQFLDDSNSIPNLEAIKEAGVPLHYQENALKVWETMRENRREAFNKYLEKQRQKKEKRQQGIELNSESDEEIDDDDPFEIYNSDEQNDDSAMQSTEIQVQDNLNNIENNSNSLTVIDPGPSTSKDSIPWVSPTTNITTMISTVTSTSTATTTTASTSTSTPTDTVEDNESREFNHKPIEIKNQGFIKVLQRRKPKSETQPTKKSKQKRKGKGKQKGKVSTTCDKLSNMNIDEENSESVEVSVDEHNKDTTN